MKLRLLPTLSALMLATLLAGCGNFSTKEEALNEKNFVPVTIDYRYSVRLPDYMSQAKSLNEDASLQYQNVFKETYVIVIDEDKASVQEMLIDNNLYDSTQSMAANYFHFQTSAIVEAMELTSETKPDELTINGMPAHQKEMTGKVEGVDGEIGYLITIIEGKETLYFMMGWTLKNRQNKYRKTFQAIAASLSEKVK